LCVHYTLYYTVHRPKFILAPATSRQAVKGSGVGYSQSLDTFISNMFRLAGLLILICCLNKAPAVPVPEETADPPTDGGGSWLDKGKKFYNDNKATVLSAIGIEEGKEVEFLTKHLGPLGINGTIIDTLAGAFSGQEGMETLVKSFSDPTKLTALLEEKNVMDEATTDSFVETIKNKFKPNGSSLLTAQATLVCGFVFLLLLPRV